MQSFKTKYPVIILAGGFGTRLKSVVQNLPKPMANINGKPFLHYLFIALQKQQIQNVILSVGYLNETIINYFGDEYLGIKIKYSIENEPLGTGGAIKKAFTFVENFAYILNGDTFFDIELNTLSENKNAAISIALKPMQHFDRYGNVELLNNRIIQFNEKQFCKNGFINGGIYFLNKKIFDTIITENKFSFEQEILEKQTSTILIEGIIFDNYFIDIGIPDDYAKAQLDFKKYFDDRN